MTSQNNPIMMKDEPTFILPKNQRFSCLGCGRCCMYPYAARLTKGDYKTLIAANIKKSKNSEKPLEPPIVSNSRYESHPYIISYEEKRCYFLTSNKQCLIELKSHSDNKPEACQRFPYLPHETPEGIFVGVDFTCPSIISNVGTEISERNYIDLKSIWHTVTSEPIFLTEGVSINWNSYISLENRSKYLIRHSESPDTALLAIYRTINQIIKNISSQNVSNENNLHNLIEDSFPLETTSDPSPSFVDIISDKIQLGIIPEISVQLNLPSDIDDWLTLPSAIDVNITPEENLRRYLLHSLFRKDLIKAPLSIVSNLESLIFRNALCQLYASQNALRKEHNQITNRNMADAIAMAELHRKQPPTDQSFTEIKFRNIISEFFLYIYGI